MVTGACGAVAFGAVVPGAWAGFWATTVVGVTGTGANSVVVVTATVVVVAGTVVLVDVVVVTGLSSFRFAGGMIAGLLGALVTWLCWIETNGAALEDC